MRRDFLIILTRIALSSNEKIQLIHIHTQNLYPTTHRPPADIRLHKTMIMKPSSKNIDTKLQVCILYLYFKMLSRF